MTLLMPQKCLSKFRNTNKSTNLTNNLSFLIDAILNRNSQEKTSLTNPNFPTKNVTGIIHAPSIPLLPLLRGRGSGLSCRRTTGSVPGSEDRLPRCRKTGRSSRASPALYNRTGSSRTGRASASSRSCLP